MELKREVEAVREALESGQAPLMNRIKLCKSYPIYEFVCEVGAEDWVALWCKECVSW